MTALQIELPDQLHRKIFEVAKAQNMPLDMIVAASLAQWLARIVPDPYLEERAQRATGKAFADVLAHVPDVPAEPHDQLSASIACLS